MTTRLTDDLLPLLRTILKLTDELAKQPEPQPLRRLPDGGVEMPDGKVEQMSDEILAEMQDYVVTSAVRVRTDTVRTIEVLAREALHIVALAAMPTN